MLAVRGVDARFNGLGTGPGHTDWVNPQGAHLFELPNGWQGWPDHRKETLRQTLRLAKYRRVYTHDPEAWLHDCIKWPEGQGPIDYQVETMIDVYKHGRLALRGPHGLGKTGTSALLLLHFATTRDGVANWKAPTTASAWQQLREFLWPEVHIWARLLNWPVIGRDPFNEPRELQVMALRLATGAAFAVASDNPAAMEGGHADSLLFIYDEAKTIEEDTFTATEGAFSGAGTDTHREAYALALSTPGPPVGPFYEIHKKDSKWADWHPVKVTKERAIAAGRISAEWVGKRRKAWGEASAVYINRVEGDFAASDEQAVIPLSWVEAAVDRWRALRVQDTRGNWAIPREVLPPFTNSGVDVADQGEDSTVFAHRFGHVVLEVETKAYNPDTMETAGEILRTMRRYDFAGYAVVDVGGGLGAGVVSRVREKRKEEPQVYGKLKVVAFQPAGASTAVDASGELEFHNQRAEAWWALRDQLDPGQPGGSKLALPESDTLLGDLTSPKWKLTSSGKVLIEDKESIKKRIGRSPDEGDAVVMSVHARPPRSRSWSPADERIPGV